MVCHCIMHQCFILLPKVCVFFQIHFAIPHNIVVRNNVQQCIRLNKQTNKQMFSCFCTTSGRSRYTSGSFPLFTSPHGRDVVKRERCVVIVLKTITFNINLTFNIYLVQSYGYTMIFIQLCAKSFKIIGM